MILYMILYKMSLIFLRLRFEAWKSVIPETPKGRHIQVTLHSSISDLYATSCWKRRNESMIIWEALGYYDVSGKSTFDSGLFIHLRLNAIHLLAHVSCWHSHFMHELSVKCFSNLYGFSSNLLLIFLFVCLFKEISILDSFLFGVGYTW